MAPQPLSHVILDLISLVWQISRVELMEIGVVLLLRVSLKEILYKVAFCFQPMHKSTKYKSGMSLQHLWPAQNIAHEQNQLIYNGINI